MSDTRKPGYYKRRREKRRKEDRLNARVLRAIPDNYIDLFPEARQMKRHFVLHIGPTNSGKTHDATDALKSAGAGIYLGPLMLLADAAYD